MTDSSTTSPLGSMSRAPTAAGTVLAGKYQIERVLGEGGMGVVVSALHLQLQQRVAVKFMLPEACQDEVAVQRFLREARAAVQIHSEHVARVIDVGTLETGAPYMVIEYLEGHDLAQELAAKGRLPIPTAVDYVLQAGEAIAEAHALGIVHRDLKPANMFITKRRDGTPLVKVLDFGISKATDASADHSLTATSAVMGSPYYMSPEQVRSSRSVDPRSDIWAMGVILHELLTGNPAFNATTASALFAQIVMDPPPPLRELEPSAPVGLEEVILRCLEKDRNKRYSSMAELAGALHEFAPERSRISIDRIGRVLGATNPDGTLGATQAVGSRGEPPRVATDTPRRGTSQIERGASVARTTGGTNEPWSAPTETAPTASRPGRIWLVASGLVLVAAVGVVFAIRSGTADPPESPIAAVPPAPTPGAAVAPPTPVTAPPVVTAPSAASAPSSTAATASPPAVAGARTTPPSASKTEKTSARAAGTSSSRSMASSTASPPAPAARPPEKIEPTLPSVLEGRK